MSPRAGEGSQVYAKGSAPHIHAPGSVARHYWFRVLALVPAVLFSILSYGEHALRTAAAVTLAAGLVEISKRFLFKKKQGFLRGHAPLTALLFMLLLPPGISFLAAFIATVLILLFAVENYGGFGAYLFHPAVLGFALLWACFPSRMVAAVSIEPPVLFRWTHSMKAAVINMTPAHLSYFLGHSSGQLGEGSPLAYLLGGLFLMRNRLIRFEMPLLYLILFNALVLIAPEVREPAGLSGMSWLTAVFLLTDPTVTPTTRQGRRLFSIGAAFASFALVAVSHQAFAVPLSVLMMNAFTPWIDEWIRPTASYFVSKTSKAHMAEASRS